LTLSGYLSLIRPVNSLMIGLAVLVGEAVATSTVRLDATTVMGFLTGVFITGFSMIINDVLDFEVDKANAARRPLVMGTVRLGGAEAMAGENGVAGQPVPHAPLPLLPLPLAELPPLFADAELVPIDGWEPVRRHYERHGSYRYVAFRGERRLIAGYSPVMARLREFWEQYLPVRWDAGKRDWLRLTTPEDVREVGRRWAEWVKGPTAKRARTRSP